MQYLKTVVCFMKSELRMLPFKKTFLFFLFIAIYCGMIMSQPFQIIGFDIPRLSPRPTMVDGVNQPLISLNGEWDFQIAGKGDIDKINVPGEWVMQGFIVNEGETAVYSRELHIPADWKGKVVKLRFDAVNSHALVRVNGIAVGEHEGSFVPFEVDITAALRDGTNTLEVDVQSLTISDRLACTSQYAVHTVGGLLRKVTLFVLPAVNIADITVNTVFDKQYRNASLQLQTSIDAENGSELEVRYTLKDAAGKIVLQKKVPVSGQQTSTSVDVKRPRHWNPEQPYLYTLQTELLQESQSLQTVHQKIGFRQVEIDGNIFLVNGQHVKLHGVNRHSVYPLTGRSISPELEWRDAELFRAANCNFIRTSHYPPAEEFLAACDSLGLVVESEASLCWIQHHASPIWKLWNYTDEKYLPFMVRANIDNVLAGKNHPSVILWSLGNESRWSPLWEIVNKLVKELEHSRPTVFHDQCWGSFNNAGSTADVANYHYPGINGPAATDTMVRPTLFGEYAHLTTYNRRESLSDPGVRSAYGKPLVEFYDSIYAHPATSGGAIWSGIDDVFHLPDGRIVGYGPWGPLDAWRRPKPEYWSMKKAYSPVRVTSINWPVRNKGYIELLVENRYDFISLREITIHAMVDGVNVPVSASVPARDKGIIKIPALKNANELYIRFTDPRGFIADEERFIKQSPEISVDVPVTPVDFSENGNAIFITQGNVKFSISKTNGIITSIEKNGKILITQGPVFCVIPINSEDGGKPNVAGETYQNNIYPIKNYPLYVIFASNIQITKNNNSLVVSMEVTYHDNSTAKQIYRFTDKGELITEYEVMYEGKEVQPYQYGLLMQLPVTMDKLNWKRNGEFTVYDEADIARAEGSSLLNAKHVKDVEEWGVVPSGDWKDDSSDLGSNDFRSTKRSIISASLENKEGDRVSVESDGKQFSRSWLQDSSIQWLIADYCNTGSEPFYGTPFTRNRMKIDETSLKGRLVLRF